MRASMASSMWFQSVMTSRVLLAFAALIVGRQVAGRIVRKVRMIVPFSRTPVPRLLLLG